MDLIDAQLPPLSLPIPCARFSGSRPNPRPPRAPVAVADDQRIAAVRDAVPWIGEGRHLRRNLLFLRVEGIDAGPPESPPPLRSSPPTTTAAVQARLRFRPPPTSPLIPSRSG